MRVATMRVVWMMVIALAATARLAAQGTGASAPPSPPDAAKTFDAYVAQGVRDWHVPGLVVAVVKDDSVVLQKAYGVRDVTSGAPADIHTRFAIGSTTKAMTVMALGMLADEGKLNWNDRVIDHLPGFQLYDPYVTRDIRIRDLLTHRSGLGGEGDLLWSMPGLTEAEIVHRMRYMHPESPFRTHFSYNNIMYQVAGDIVATVSGMSWEQFLTTRIFTPLGMHETIPTVAGTIGQSDVATPHELVHDSLRVIPMRSTDQIKAAGSVYSSIADMTRWVQFLLDSGRVNGRRLVSDSVFREIFTPQIMADRSLYPALTLSEPHFFTYGLAFFLQDYGGYKLEMHTGSIDGMCALIALVPERRLGVYVLENVDHAELRHALMYKAIDTWLGTGTRDWSTELHTMFTKEHEQAVAARARRSAHETTAPASLPLAQYAGTYRDSAFGDVTISLTAGVLHVAYLSGEASLAHERYDVFRAHDAKTKDANAKSKDANAKSKDLDSVAVTFLPDGTGGVHALQMFHITFLRVPSPTAAEAGRVADTTGAGVDVIRRMHDRYASTWYSSLSFTEQAEQRGADGQMSTTKWWEEGKLPGRLRIDIGYPATDTVHPRRIIVYANDSLYAVTPGKPLRRAKGINLLLVLGFDVYRQPVARTVAELEDEGFDLSQVHDGVWHGRPVHVVGAAAGDTTSKQFWIDRDRDVFVRMIEPTGTALGGSTDAWFARYRPLAGGWIATEVGVTNKGVMQLHEIYSDIRANVDLPEAWFDPARLP